MATYQRKLSKGIFCFYKFDYQGHTYRSKCIYKTKGQAKKAEADRLHDLNQNDQIIQEQVLLYDAVQDRLAYLKQVKSEKYYNDNKRYLEDFINSINYDIDIRAVGEWHISTYLMEFSKVLRGKKKKNYAINASIRCLKAFFNYAIQKNSLDIKNPVKSKFYPIEKRMKYIPTDAEIEAVLNICDQGQKQLIEFVLATGARISEALNLKYRDILEQEVVLYTRKSKNSDLTPRKVPFKFALPTADPDSLVFGRWTEQPRFIEMKLKKLKMKSWSWHSLRHRFASKLSKEGKPLFEIMSLLGHQNLETTQKYLQLL